MDNIVLTSRQIEQAWNEADRVWIRESSPVPWHEFWALWLCRAQVAKFVEWLCKRDKGVDSEGYLGGELVVDRDEFDKALIAEQIPSWPDVRAAAGMEGGE